MRASKNAIKKFDQWFAVPNPRMGSLEYPGCHVKAARTLADFIRSQMFQPEYTNFATV
jgi:hypothetical protein